jgi:hypothetical protein
MVGTGVGDSSRLCDALALGGAADCRAPTGVDAGDWDALPHAVATSAMHMIAASRVHMRITVRRTTAGRLRMIVAAYASAVPAR